MKPEREPRSLIEEIKVANYWTGEPPQNCQDEDGTRKLRQKHLTLTKNAHTEITEEGLN